MEDLVEVLHIGSVCGALFDFEAIGAPAVLGFQVGIAQQDSDQHLTLERREFELLFVGFDGMCVCHSHLLRFATDCTPPVGRLPVARKFRLSHHPLAWMLGVQSLRGHEDFPADCPHQSHFQWRMRH
ncbi:MAG: hypothetical protein WHT28_05445 [Fimbriimonadales bacterium]